MLGVAALVVGTDALTWPAWVVTLLIVAVAAAPGPVVDRIWHVDAPPALALTLAAADALGITALVALWPDLAESSIVLFAAAAVFHATAGGLRPGLLGAGLGVTGALLHTDALVGTTWLQPVPAATTIACVTFIVLIVGSFARTQREMEQDLAIARHRLDEAAGQARNATDEARARSAELERAREQLLRLASHELRTPLTAVAGALEVLEVRGDALSESRRAALLEVARRSTTDLIHVSEQVLDLVRLVEPRTSLLSHPFSLAEVVDSGMRRVEHLFGQRLVTVDVDEVPMALGEPGATARIVENLLSNVLAHTPDDAALHVTVHRERDQVVLEIRDEGPGMVADVLTLSEPMVRGEGATERGRGLGIGLALCRRYAELQGASFEIDGSDGTTARLCLRAASIADPGTMAEQAAASGSVTA